MERYKDWMRTTHRVDPTSTSTSAAAGAGAGVGGASQNAGPDASSLPGALTQTDGASAGYPAAGKVAAGTAGAGFGAAGTDAVGKLESSKFGFGPPGVSFALGGGDEDSERKAAYYGSPRLLAHQSSMRSGFTAQSPRSQRRGTTLSQGTAKSSALFSAAERVIADVPIWTAESLLALTKPHLKPRPRLDEAFREPIGPRVRDYDQKIWGPNTAQDHNRYVQL